MEEKRRYHIDILRLLACFAVIINHFDPGFLAFNTQPEGSLSYWCLLFLSVFCKFAVPLFFMISGALLLRKTESIKQIITKRTSKVLLSLITTSVFYYFFEKYVIARDDYAVSIVYTNEAEYHLWYLYAYIAFLCSLPFLRSIAKEINSEKIFFLAVIYFLLRYSVPLFELLLFNNQYHLNTHLSGAFICTDLFFLPILGFYIENKMNMERVSLGKLSFLWISNVLLLLLAAYATSLVNANGANIVKQTYIGCFSSITAFVLYITIKKLLRIKPCKSKHTKKILLSLSSCTFGIYLIHLLPMRLLNVNPEFVAFYNSKGPILMVILWLALSVIIFALSYIIVWVLRKIPIIREVF